MRRRTFVASLPLAAAGALTHGNAAAEGSAGSQASQAEAEPALPKFQTVGEERFIRPDVHAGDRPSGASFASRSAAMGRSGAAGTAHPIATLTAIEMLKRGGSAVDAAVAANACLGFLEPTSCGLGGDCFAMVWDPKLNKVVGLAGSGRSPKALTLETVRQRAVNGVIPSRGRGLHFNARRAGCVVDAASALRAIEVGGDSGACDSPGGDRACRCRRLSATTSSADLAGFVKPGSGVEETANAVHTFAPGGAAPNEGDVFRNPDLARTYRMIAEGGRDAFYDGPIAQTIEAYFKRIGGWLAVSDLREQHAEWNDPLVTKYRGVDVYGMAANTQGLATLQMLNILENFDLRGMGFQSSASIHAQVEAKRLAYEDRARYYADPNFAKIPIEWLNSKEYAAERAKLIRPDKILTPIYPGQAPSHGDTTYFTVSDADGMMISMIQSNFRGLGSGLVADGLGFMFQDRGELFSLQDGHPNIYAPGKRPFQTIIPGFATRDGKPWMSFGVMGGDMQPQGQSQIIINRVDYGLDIQAAGDSPRWHHEGSSQSMGEDLPGLGPMGVLRLESGVPVASRKALIELGWPMGESDGGFGRYECIELRASGGVNKGERFYSAASEMRADGCALAY